MRAGPLCAGFVSHAVVALCGLSVLLALVPLGFILFFVVSQGVRSLNWAFFTEMPQPVGEPGGGMANAIVGPLISSRSAHCWRFRSAS